LWVLKRFSEALVFSGYLSHSFAIRPPKAKYEKVTPLKIRKTPEDILKFAKNTSFSFPKQRKIEGMPNKDRSEIDFILAVLLGYFGGFGPGELFALEKSDLLTGQYAVNNCKTYVGFQKHKLGSRLGVVINKTLPVVGEVVPLVKNDYRYGVSNIWNPTAAKMIADIVSKRPDGRLFPFSYSYLLTRWRQFVRRKLGATPHDLRRASGLYLGRDKRVDLSLLQDHMRHADIQTTMLYCREPATPDNIIKIKQDFDDVA
jgi:integrase